MPGLWGLGERTLRFPACREGTGERPAPRSSALSCQGLSLIPGDYSSIQQTRSACLMARPWQKDSPSPPWGRWAASVTGIFFCLCPSVHPILSLGLSVLSSPLFRLPTPHILVPECTRTFRTAFPIFPTVFPVTPLFLAQERRLLLLQEAPPAPRLGQALSFRLPCPSLPTQSGHSGTALCPHPWTVSPERVRPGLSRSLLCPSAGLGTEDMMIF